MGRTKAGRLPPGKALIPIERIASQIYLIRGEKVMLDEDLAALYDVPTKRLNEQVSRNRERFPNDFMFRLTAEELGNLRSQNATSSFRAPQQSAET